MATKKKEQDPNPVLEALDVGRRGLVAAGRDLRHHLKGLTEVAGLFRGIGMELRAGADRLDGFVSRFETILDRVEALEVKAKAAEEAPKKG